MATNRDYTGLVRTPSSMAWLIKQRARISGKIEKFEKEQSEIPGRIETLRAYLESLDGVFPLHDVLVDPGLIAPKKGKRQPVTPYGAMTRSIYECLREGKANGPMFTTEIAMYVARACSVQLDSQTRNYLIHRVGRRLQAMAFQGELDRHHLVDPGNTEEGRWSLRLETTA